MEITINENNINNYSNGVFNDVIKIDWRAGEYHKNINNNFPNLVELNCSNNQLISLNFLSNCINLQILECGFNKITSLEPLSNCINLHTLRCSHNQITTLEPLYNCINLHTLSCVSNQITSLEPLSNCINLHTLDCGFNQIIALESLFNCVKLQKIECYDNKIISLQPLSNCVNLHTINCSFNQLTSLEFLFNCVNLRKLICDDNHIKSLEPLSNCVNLYLLSCDNNQIASIEPLIDCVNLQILLCDNNQITSLDSLIYLRQLMYISLYNNPIEVLTIQVQRFFDRIRTNENSSIYHDRQNIHDTRIQRTVCDSLRSLLTDPKPVFMIDDIINSNLDNKTKEAIVEYCQDQTIHSIYLITYQELLSYVWNRIIKSEHQSELKKILEEQISDSECMCFTGRFNRTISVLIGFFDDVKINISDKSRISAIILNSRNKVVPYDYQVHQDVAKKELIDAGYTELEIKEWIEAIMDY